LLHDGRAGLLRRLREAVAAGWPRRGSLEVTLQQLLDMPAGRGATVSSEVGKQSRALGRRVAALAVRLAAP